MTAPLMRKKNKTKKTTHESKRQLLMDAIFFLSQHIKLYSVSLSNFLSSGRTTFRTNYQHSGPFHTTNQPHKAIYFYQPLWGSAYWVAVYGTRVIICVAAENLSHIFQLASLVDTSLWKQLKAAVRPRWTASRHTKTHTHHRLRRRTYGKYISD